MTTSSQTSAPRRWSVTHISNWVSYTWADLAPSYDRGRVDIGRLIIQTRKSAQRAAWAYIEIGADMERERPAAAKSVERSQPEDRPVARGHLRLV